MHYVEITDNDGNYVGLFRIIPSGIRKLASIIEVQYKLEHVLSTLLSDVLFKYHQRTNFTTRANIEYVLAQQSTKHWRLGVVEITRYFHYKWENENGLLGALFSIAEPFDEPYEWTWDTLTYPWTLNLVKPDVIPSADVRYGKNIAEIEREIDPSNIVNRLYPLGSGEGVNQLDITRVNGGVPYIEDADSIAKYGLQQYVWADRRFEDVDSLYASARKFLGEWAIPKVINRIKAVDLSTITGLSIDKLTLGKVVRITDPDIGVYNARIVAESCSDIFEAPFDKTLQLTNKGDGIGTTLADIERRQEVNEVYSQGATNIMTFGYQDNCDANVPAVIPFYIDDDVVHVNTLELTFRTKAFRAYSQATKGGGAIVDSTSSGGSSTATSSSGGSSTATSSSGGGTSKSTASGGGGATTSQAKIFPNEMVVISSNPSYGDYEAHTHLVDLSNDGAFDHSHGVTIPAHSHDFDIPAHTHSVVIPAHTHDVAIPAHTHSVSLPNHTHEVEHKIVELGTVPSQVTVKVDGVAIPHTETTGNRINLVDYASKDANGNVKRGRHEVTISPNGLARIEADLISRVFIQSHLGTSV